MSSEGNPPLWSTRWRALRFWLWLRMYRVRRGLVEAAKTVSPILAELRKNLLYLVLLAYAVLAAPIVVQIYRYASEVSYEKPDAIRDAVLTLGALLGVPFVVWRAWVVWLQADTAEQRHFTELFTKSIELLSAEKVDTVSSGRTRRAPNIEQRIGAIYALERIARDSAKDYWPVIAVLCNYVRENGETSSERPPELDQDELLNGEAWSAHRRALMDWLRSVPEPRSDIQAAVDVLGRRSRSGIRFERRNRLRLDLRGANLQKIRFSKWYSDELGASECNFENADFSGASLEAAHMISANLNGCLFDSTRLDGADLIGVQLRGALIHSSSLQCCAISGADAREADIQVCNMNGATLQELDIRRGALISCRCRYVDFTWADFSNAALIANDMESSQIEKVKLEGCEWRGNIVVKATVFETNFSSLSRERNESLDLIDAFGDSTTQLPCGVERPASWPSRVLDWSERDAYRPDHK